MTTLFFIFCAGFFAGAMLIMLAEFLGDLVARHVARSFERTDDA